MGGSVNTEARFKWSFGNSATAEGGDKSVTASTGTGVRVNTFGFTRAATFYLETDAVATCSYQILTARTLTGPVSILSSGTLSTGALATYQSTVCPLSFVTIRTKTLNSSANLFTVELFGN